MMKNALCRDNSGGTMRPRALTARPDGLTYAGAYTRIIAHEAGEVKRETDIGVSSGGFVNASSQHECRG